MADDPAFSERRREHRQASADRVRLVFGSGLALDADLVDRSLKGMRVRLEDAAALPSDLSVLSVSGAAVYEARVVWRAAPYAGLSLVRTVDMRSPQTTQTAAAHKLWREHARG